MAAPFLSASDVKAFEDLTNSAMPDTCELFYRDETRDGRERTVVYRPRGDGTSISCRVKSLARGSAAANPTKAQAGQLASAADYQLALPLGYEIESGDAVRVHVKQTGKTHVLVVDRVDEPHTYAVDVQAALSLPPSPLSIIEPPQAP